MIDSAYVNNLNAAVSYLKIGESEHAKNALLLALSQITPNEKNADNKHYLRILSLLSKILLNEKDYGSAQTYIQEGLSCKKDHLDLLMLHMILLVNLGVYSDIFMDALNYLLAVQDPDCASYEYEFLNDKALDQLFENILPLAYEHTPNHDEVKKLVAQLCDKTNNAYLKRVHSLLVSYDERAAQ